MNYTLHGRSDACAPTVLLSAGLGGLGAWWMPQVEALADRYRVLLYDHRGTGANAATLPPDHDIGTMAEDARAVLDAAGVARAHVVGHALGGLIALELARRHPDRVGRLVVVNGWSRPDAHTRRCFAARLALLDHAGPETYVKAQPIFLYPAAWMSRHASRMEAEDASALAHFQGASNLHRRIAALLAYDATGRLGGIRAPVLLAASRDDVLVPWTASEQLATELPDAAVWVTPEGGHGFTAIEPDAFNERLLEFLSA